MSALGPTSSRFIVELITGVVLKTRSSRRRQMYFVSQVYVEVIDDADDVTPEFPCDVIRLEFPEDIPVSTMLYIAKATVPAKANLTISYGLNYSEAVTNDSLGYFSVDRWTGVVRLRREIDRETNAFHRFSITATIEKPQQTGNLNVSTENRRQSGNLNVLIAVIDSNDNSPIFSQSSYTCHVTSSTSGFSPPCSVSASDLDEGENGRLVYFLSAEDDATDYYRIDPHGGVIYVVNSSRGVPGNRTLTVVATDAGALPRKSSALVLVTSEVSPNVNCAVDSLEIEENRPAYSIVGSVRLTYDDGTNVPVTRYQLNQDGGQETFDIDVNTGQIVTKSILDRETFSSYRLSVSAVYLLPGLCLSKITSSICLFVR